jgi:undecaprenyl diphosphate synthase
MYGFEQVSLPVHVAIIMDGNGRWAQQRNLPRVEGHAEGVQSVREIVTTTREVNIPYLTLYAFSTENWSRPRTEVKRLMDLLEIYLEAETPLMMEKDIRFNVIGNMTDFSRRLQSKLREVMAVTSRNGSLVLNLALSYGGRQEIIRAVRMIAEDVKKGTLKRISEKVFQKYLFTGNMPDPDFLIRTSGEMRISNFMLWQIAYTELYVTNAFWPDFRREAYIEALREFTRRDRRFGKVKEA